MNKTSVVKNLSEKSIVVSREFNAPLELVWKAYTESKLLDQWWAPAPWRAETKYMDFREGGYWLYAMVSPENTKHWGRMNYITIQHHQNYTLEDVFCDEQGMSIPGLPVSKGTTAFSKTEVGTRVEFKMIYHSEEDIQKIIEMGFEQGISACMDQLENLFKQNKL